MNIDRTHEHEIDRWENEGGSFQYRTPEIVNLIGLQQRSSTNAMIVASRTHVTIQMSAVIRKD